MSVHLPDITFENYMTIYGKDKTIELITYEEGHTGSDSIMYIREHRVVFMSDLLFVNSHPFLAECNPATLLSILEEVSELDAHIFVPGHCPVGAQEDLEKLKAYIQACEQLVDNSIENDEDGEFSSLEIPEAFDGWGFPHFLAINVKSMYQRAVN